MSVSAISNSNSWMNQAQSGQFGQLRQDLRQLGQDLQAGDLTAAQADFVTLQNDMGQVTNSGAGTANDSLAQALNQLGQDLQAGDLSAAQQDYAALRQVVRGMRHHHHHHHQDDSGTGSMSSLLNSVSQAFTQLGQALQTGDLAGAQQAFASIQQAFQQFVSGSGLSSNSSSAANGTDNSASTPAPSAPSTPSAGTGFQYSVSITYVFVAQLRIETTTASA